MTELPTSQPFDAEAFLKTLSHRPGVYRMLNDKGEVIYVGKAKDLKKRVSSYFRTNPGSPKTEHMVKHIADMEVIVTHTESEALLLENNLIKQYKPRYNILLRDDKSYPYIYLSSKDEYPRLGFHRGARKLPGRYFGPYPNSGAVRETLNLLQKLFAIRQCEDSYFQNRSRPCLQYQIKRCTAPCVGLISHADYAEDIRHAILFLEGKDNQVIDELVKRMDQASSNLEYEQAARYRDQITDLRAIQAKQYVSNERGDLDIIAADMAGGLGCIQVFFIRDGRNLGNKSFFPKNTADSEPAEMLSAFIEQFYLGQSQRELPAEILVNMEPVEQEWLEEGLSESAGRKVAISHKLRGDRARWLEIALTNVRTALQSRLASRSNMLNRFETLQDALGLEDLPQRIECFDISHSQGEETVASCVVFDSNGPLKSDYRRFNIKDIQAGDDYAALHQALARRYTRLKKGEAKLPDILLIDGGKGQVNEAQKVLRELQIEEVIVLGIAKGPRRRPGEESLFLSTKPSPFILPTDSPALHLLQQIDGEAHRFAITGHRLRRDKKRSASTLEAIPGLGPKRRQSLLRQLGGLQEVSRAGVEDLAKVPGISKDLAQKIYDYLHEAE